MKGKKWKPWLAALCAGLLLLGAGCAQDGRGESPAPFAVEGVLVKLEGYTPEPDEWALYQEGGALSLFTADETVEVAGGPLKEGQQVAVTCQEVLEIYPSLLHEPSRVEVLGEATQEEMEEISAQLEKLAEELEPPAP